MLFLKETDYHSSRAYGRAPAARTLVDHYRLRVSLALAWATLEIRKLLRPTALTHASSRSRRGDKNVAARSTPPQVVPVRRPISELFPVPSPDARPRRMRNDY